MTRDVLAFPKRVLYGIVYFFWVCLPAGMGGAPWHRFHRIFKLEREK
jgi:hypothetical protein